MDEDRDPAMREDLEGLAADTEFIPQFWRPEFAGGLVKTAHLVCANWSQTDLRVWTFSSHQAFGYCSISLLRRRRDVCPFLFHRVPGIRVRQRYWSSHDEDDVRRQRLAPRSVFDGDGKLHAMFEASASLMAGGTASSVVDRYREHVAANAKRLSH
jgi:hypothetical protein